jgi:hypothetical protein
MIFIPLIVFSYFTLQSLNINEGCTDTFRNKWNNFDRSPDKYEYQWYVIVQDICNSAQSSWPWGMYLGKCVNEILPGWPSWGSRPCGIGGYTTRNTIDFPYPNNTICYRPPNCRPQENNKNTDLHAWVEGWDCLPILTCINGNRIFYKTIAIYIFNLSFLGYCIFFINSIQSRQKNEIY